MGALRAWVLPVVVVGLLTSGGAAVVVARTSAGVELPDGWRWESYRDVEVAVPRSWGHTSSSSPSSACTDLTAPLVGRPGTAPLVLCTGPAGAAESAERHGSFLEFRPRLASFGTTGPLSPGSPGSPRSPGSPGSPTTVGDRTTVTVGSADVIVQAPRELREQILGTIRTIETDANGCAVSDPLVANPGLRPSPATDVTRLIGIRSVTACMYELPQPRDEQPGPPPLFGSAQWRGQEAADAVRAVADAPVADGRQDIGRCSQSYGFHIVTLLVRSGQGPSRLHLRFSGCRHNGIDDGVTVRALTHDNTYRFVSGATRAPYFVGGPAGKTEAPAGF